jgi:hypothetical protein
MSASLHPRTCNTTEHCHIRTRQSAFGRVWVNSQPGRVTRSLLGITSSTSGLDEKETLLSALSALVSSHVVVKGGGNATVTVA